MKVLRSIADLASLGAPAHLAIGVFDGIHRGHQAVIGAARESAMARSGIPVVVTFDPHPVTVLRPTAAPRLLTSPAHQQRILADMGIDHLLVIEFDQTFAAREAEEFIRDLAEAADPLGQICVGAEWRFGRGRAGDVAMLQAIGAELGFGVTGVDAVVSDNGEIISSTLVRQAVLEGDLDRARDLLGRDYTVLGEVVEGRKLGRTIGFPTANLSAGAEQFPPSGVYAVSAELDGGESVRGVANLGHRPTVEEAGARRKLEVHLFDFDREIYGQSLEVRFDRFIREERKFDSLDELKAQIALDAEAAKELD